MNAPWLSSAAYEQMASGARARGFHVLADYYMKQAHDAAVAHEREKTRALDAIARARQNAAQAYEDAKEQEDIEAVRLVVWETPPLLVALAAALPRSGS